MVVVLLGIVWWKMSPKATDFEGASLSIAKREGTSIPSMILLRYELPDQVLDSAFVEVVGNIGMVHRVRLTAQTGYVPATFMSSGIKSAFFRNGEP